MHIGVLPKKGERTIATRNTVPALLDQARPSLDDIAKWVGVTRATCDAWRERKTQPRPERRAALVKAVRKHARLLLALADRVDAEGRTAVTRADNPNDTEELS